MNKKIKVIFVSAVLGTSLLFGGCSQSVEDMADEVCECVKNNYENKNFRECESMAQEHEKAMDNDDEKLKIYTEKLGQCESKIIKQNSK